jgi:methylmalonyl-CoA mutase
VAPSWSGSRALTDAAADILPLAADFPPARRDDWLRLVERVLKGAPFDRELVASTHDGLTIQPLYARAAAPPQVQPGRAAGTPWQILQRVDHPQALAANAQARHDLENGASGLSLVFAGAAGAYGYGLGASEAAIARALADIDLDRVAIELDCGPEAGAAARGIATVAARLSPRAVNIRFGFDPLGAMTRAASPRWSEAADQLGRQVADLAGAGHRGPFAVADGRVIHNAGGSEAQELGFALAAAASYLRVLEGARIALDHARAMIYFRLAADADQFLTIAKFRALRRLWARVEEACGLAPAPTFVSAETAWRMMTKRDPYVNMLRATIAVFSANIGGADAVTVLPFTLVRGLPDRFARRMARNTQLILAAESSLGKVSEAAAGAGVIEHLTTQLCAAAWTQFQDIERAGGTAAALAAGLIQERVGAVRSAREAAVAARAERLTGTSDFADLDEATVAVLDIAPVASLPAATAVDPLPRIRLAEPFEELRDVSDRMQAARGSRPKIFLASLGTVADFSPRANFARSFFEAGGIEAVADEGLARTSAAGGGEAQTDLTALAAAFRARGTALACLCATDEVYAREGVGAAKALAAAGALHIYAIGDADPPPELQAAGVRFIGADRDALTVLRMAQEQFTASVS